MRKPRSNAAEYTVSEISGALRKTIEETYGNVRVRGEISGYRGAHSSGHAYFALKDDKARLEAVIWRTSLQSLKFLPEEGLEVIAGGRLSSYAGSSKYQLIIETLAPAGAGALMALLNARRQKLAAEGLFDESRKKPLPFLPKTVGVITSPTGAVIRDIIHRVRGRFPLPILVWPARMQGETAAAEVIAAIRGFNALPAGGAVPRPDLLIIARGGGALEDLWGFNDEALVRAAAESALPIISAIGHETDWTLLDYAADKRAPTPTGAAEMAVPVQAELLAAAAALAARLGQAQQRLLLQNSRALTAAARALPAADRLLAEPRRRLDAGGGRLAQALRQMARQKRSFFSGAARRLSPYLILGAVSAKQQLCRHLRQRLGAALSHNIQQNRQKLGMAAKLLQSLSLASILERGFALIADKDGALIGRKALMPPAGEPLRLRFADGAAAATAGGAAETAPQKAAAKPRQKKTAKGKKPAGQGNLF